MSLTTTPLYYFAALSGFFTWSFHRIHPVRGDYAAVFYTVCLLALYATTVISKIPFPFTVSITGMGIHALFALACTVGYRLSPWHPLASYPGPYLWRASSLFLGRLSFSGRRHLVLDDLHNQYGPFLRIGPNQLSVNTTSSNIMIYGAATHMEKDDSYITPGHLDALALFFKSKSRDFQAERKRIWTQAFTSSSQPLKPENSVTHFIPALERRTWELLICFDRRQSDSPNQTFDLYEALCHWSYDFAGEMVFGGCNDIELMKRGDPEGLLMGGKNATRLLDSVGQSPWLMDIAWHIPAGKAMVRLRDVAAAAMRRRVESDADTTMRDLSSYWLEARSPHGEKIPLTDMELDAVVAIQAASDNTATTITLAFYFILSSPQDYYQQLQKELDDAFPGRTGPLDWDILAKLPLLNAIIAETLRLGTPFYLPRVVPKGGATIDSRYIPEGTSVTIAAYSQQISPQNFYPDPLGFRAERWLPGGLGPGSITNAAALFSFSSGPYVCVAKAFAHQEMRYVIARIVLAYDFQLTKGFNAAAYREGILNMRTTILQEPLFVIGQRRPGVIIPEDH
ncbi:cytochrome P450 [Crucibulum laeve]|uniref:Cytochrome P450 n=1 Tax=Crucibulum laeve TaxID=68775 RepID=A0A5C3LKQ6_9AGAR|nr:cytochrome P450 [Crucibulum laeve]